MFGHKDANGVSHSLLQNLLHLNTTVWEYTLKAMSHNNTISEKIF